MGTDTINPDGGSFFNYWNTQSDAPGTSNLSGTTESPPSEADGATNPTTNPEIDLAAWHHIPDEFRQEYQRLTSTGSYSRSEAQSLLDRVGHAAIVAVSKRRVEDLRSSMEMFNHRPSEAVALLREDATA